MGGKTSVWILERAWMDGWIYGDGERERVVTSNEM
jgi:hypothetical protein